MIRKSLLFGAAIPAAAIFTASVVPAQAPKGTANSFLVIGEEAGDFTGSSVSGVGDWRGDGQSDFVVGSPHFPGPPIGNGLVHVVYGKATDTSVNLTFTSGAQYSSAGLSVPESGFGSAVAGIGDVDRDGLSDLSVTGPLVASNRGTIYINFGRASGSLAAATWIDGARAGDQAGTSISGIGDFDGDGFNDILIGAPFHDVGEQVDCGAAYVLFGASDLDSLVPGQTPGTLGTRILQILGAGSGDRLGISVTGVGDTNGDGRTDILLGASGANGGAGAAFLIRGRQSRDTIDLLVSPNEAVRFNGSGAGGGAGTFVGSAGDINADGFNDFAISAPGQGSTFSRPNAGRSYVIFGRSNFGSPVALAELDNGSDARGFAILGASANAGLGPVSGAGDFNADGFHDLLIGAPGTNNDEGAFFIVLGKASVEAVDLSQPGSGLFLQTGDATGFGRLGASVSFAGDFNGDGMPEVVAGAPLTLGTQGAAVVLFNQITPLLETPRTYRTTVPFSGGGWTGIGSIGDMSDDYLPASRVWLGYGGGQGHVRIEATLTRADSAIGGFEDRTNVANVLWEVRRVSPNTITAPTSSRVRFRYLDQEIEGLDEAQLVLYEATNINGPWTPVANQAIAATQNLVTADPYVASGQFFALSVAAPVGPTPTPSPTPTPTGTPSPTPSPSATPTIPVSPIVPALLAQRAPNLATDDLNGDGIVDAADVVRD